jgi:hypothetical protein
MELTNAAQQLGKKGGRRRAELYTHEQLSQWAKLGGRPRKDAQGQGEKDSASRRGKGRQK